MSCRSCGRKAGHLPSCRHYTPPRVRSPRPASPPKIIRSWYVVGIRAGTPILLEKAKTRAIANRKRERLAAHVEGYDALEIRRTGIIDDEDDGDGDE